MVKNLVDSMISVATTFIGRTSIDEQIFKILSKSDTNQDLLRNFSELGIFLVHSADKFPNMDCQDWLFNELGFPQYTFQKYGSIQQDLIWGRIPEFKQTKDVVDGAIVAYAVKGIDYLVEEQPRPYNHFGLLKLIDGEPFVISKWGGFKSTSVEKTHVFKHKLFGMDFFGNYVDFYQRVD